MSSIRLQLRFAFALIHKPCCISQLFGTIVNYRIVVKFYLSLLIDLNCYFATKLSKYCMKHIDDAGVQKYGHTLAPDKLKVYAREQYLQRRSSTNLYI